MAVDYDSIKKILADVEDPYTGQAFADGLRTVSEEGSTIRLMIGLGYAAAGRYEQFADAIGRALADHYPDFDYAIGFECVVIPNRITKAPQIRGVKHVVAVASGKGGVGKSTVAVNIALALAAEGAKVGLLDGDIYGPSQGIMLGARGMQPKVVSETSMLPVEVHGLKCMSLAFVMADRMPAVWRGPMASGAFQQLMTQTDWGELDYLIVDMPPGTGDIQLTLSQKAAISGAVIVTTPQDIALIDAKKGIEMFRTVEIPILGVIENMSVHVCRECGHREHLFGEGGGRSIAEEFETRLLGEIPLDMDIRQQCDGGVPPVLANPDGEVAEIFREVARSVGADLVRRANVSQGIPVVQIYDNKG